VTGYFGQPSDTYTKIECQEEAARLMRKDVNGAKVEANLAHLADRLAARSLSRLSLIMRSENLQFQGGKDKVGFIASGDRGSLHGISYGSKESIFYEVEMGT
jgi:hypothetical protein